MKRLLKVIIALIAVFAVSKMVPYIMGVDAKSVANKALTEQANDLNRQLPRNIDPNTTLTKVEFDGKIWRVHYTLASGAGIDPQQKEKYESNAATQICNGDVKNILKQNVTIEYVYSYTNSSGDQKMRISIPPDKCS